MEKSNRKIRLCIGKEFVSMVDGQNWQLETSIELMEFHLKFHLYSESGCKELVGSFGPNNLDGKPIMFAVACLTTIENAYLYCEKHNVKPARIDDENFVVALD